MFRITRLRQYQNLCQKVIKNLRRYVRYIKNIYDGRLKNKKLKANSGKFWATRVLFEHQHLERFVGDRDTNRVARLEKKREHVFRVRVSCDLKRIFECVSNMFPVARFFRDFDG